MESDTYYRPDLAWVHHAGYARHVELTAPGIERMLGNGGLSAGARVLDVGCGSGLLARALRPGGVLAIDLMTERYCEARNVTQVHAKVEADWAIVTRFSRPENHRFDRAITVFRLVDGTWRRSDEHHRNVTMEVDDALSVLRESGVDAHVQPAFDGEKLPEGLVVLTGVRGFDTPHSNAEAPCTD